MRNPHKQESIKRTKVSVHVGYFTALTCCLISAYFAHFLRIVNNIHFLGVFEPFCEHSHRYQSATLRCCGTVVALQQPGLLFQVEASRDDRAIKRRRQND